MPTTPPIAIRDLSVTLVPLAALKPNPANARTHSKRQIRQIARSLEAFGWTNPVLVDGTGLILAGHGRVEAAKLLGLHQIPTITLDDLCDEQRRAYVLADNQLALKAGWDDTLLGLELKALTELDLDFDVTITGFETGEIDLLIASLDAAEDDEDELPDMDPLAPPVTRPGDLWLIGPHRLLCGDALDPSAYDALMDGKTARMVFTDPPYNVPIEGHVSGLGRNHHADFAMASGEMTSAAFTDFLETVFDHMARHSTGGALHYICMDWRHLPELTTAGQRIFGDPLNLCVWVKSNGGMGSLYRSQHELVALFKKGTAPHINNVELGRHGRNRTNVWHYAGQNSFGKERDEALAAHPTVKPVALVEDAIKDVTHRGDIVLDPFIGSGTTLVAAECTGRLGYGMELDPIYCDRALARLARKINAEPALAVTGQSFDEVKAERERSIWDDV